MSYALCTQHPKHVVVGSPRTVNSLSPTESVGTFCIFASRCRSIGRWCLTRVESIRRIGKRERRCANWSDTLVCHIPGEKVVSTDNVTVGKSAVRALERYVFGMPVRDFMRGYMLMRSCTLFHMGVDKASAMELLCYTKMAALLQVNRKDATICLNVAICCHHRVGNVFKRVLKVLGLDQFLFSITRCIQRKRPWDSLCKGFLDNLFVESTDIPGPGGEQNAELCTIFRQLLSTIWGRERGIEDDETLIMQHQSLEDLLDFYVDATANLGPQTSTSLRHRDPTPVVGAPPKTDEQATTEGRAKWKRACFARKWKKYSHRWGQQLPSLRTVGHHVLLAKPSFQAAVKQASKAIKSEKSAVRMGRCLAHLEDDKIEFKFAMSLAIVSMLDSVVALLFAMHDREVFLRSTNPDRHKSPCWHLVSAVQKLRVALWDSISDSRSKHCRVWDVARRFWPPGCGMDECESAIREVVSLTIAQLDFRFEDLSQPPWTWTYLEGNAGGGAPCTLDQWSYAFEHDFKVKYNVCDLVQMVQRWLCFLLRCSVEGQAALFRALYYQWAWSHPLTTCAVEIIHANQRKVAGGFIAQPTTMKYQFAIMLLRAVSVVYELCCYGRCLARAPVALVKAFAIATNQNNSAHTVYKRENQLGRPEFKYLCGSRINWLMMGCTWLCFYVVDRRLLYAHPVPCPSSDLHGNNSSASGASRVVVRTACRLSCLFETLESRSSAKNQRRAFVLWWTGHCTALTRLLKSTQQVGPRRLLILTALICGDSSRQSPKMFKTGTFALQVLPKHLSPSQVRHLGLGRGSNR